ncbi:copper chaperone PCu(A)C [uncultured Roseovarius sp.]|uniref:copper chaperone PCu(A)C n=2 Tax=Roseovarius TaxID=74030 RepID=UPI0025F8CA64|nr:copper chaperone PCu(A)C [uncultured Roseovarius sp.]
MSLKSTLIAALAVTTLALPVFAQDIDVMDPYARSASPIAKTGAAFMLINNNGDTDDRLIEARSPLGKLVQLHTHIQTGEGVMKMTHVEEGFAVPAGETLVLQRGGNHVMFMGLEKGFEAGDTVPLTLVFEKSGEITLDVPVDPTRKPKEGHGKMHGSGN